MKAQVIDEQQGQKTFVLAFDKGEEAASGLLAFAKDNNLSAAHFTAVGGFSDCTLGYFDMEKKEYTKIPVNEQVEVFSIDGNIALDQGQPKVHAHTVVGRSDGTLRGGHLMEAHVRPTLEVVIVESPQRLQRKTDPETGLTLLSLEA